MRAWARAQGRWDMGRVVEGVSGDGFAGRALLGSCRAGISPVPLPGHPVLTRVMADSVSVCHGAFPTLSSGWEGLRMMCLPRWETEESADAAAARNCHLTAQLAVLAGIPAQRFAV